MSGVRVGVDVGGTFTDVVVDDGSSLRVAKVPSTPRDQAEGVLAGLSRADVEASAVQRLSHGTTVATNAVLERRGARTVFVTSEGFRDLLEIGRQNRPSLYDFTVTRPPPVVPRELVVEAAERVAADGSVLRELDDVEGLAARVRELEPEAVAVCLLFSFVRPDHERRIGDALSSLGVPVSLSSEILPVFREFERAATTAMNAYVAPVMSRYLRSLQSRLIEAGVTGDVDVMRSGGGTFSLELASRFPVHTLLSGPAAGAWGAAALASAAGYPDAVAFDMGGTSTDATLIEGGRPRTNTEGHIGGLPFAVSSTEIHTVGAGGGSIGWRDAGGSLRVGPRSAGADPGPAAYGRGGTEPTVTDAYVALGMLSSQMTLGGSVHLDDEAAKDAVAGLAAELDLSLQETAPGIVRVAEAQIAKALRVVSVERGRDPRRYALVAFGGAGPLHQGPLSRELGSTVVIVPRYPGVLSALGLLAAPRTAESVRTHLTQLTPDSRDLLEGTWRELHEETERLMKSQGVSDADIIRTADCRYRGQSFELEVEAPPDASADDLFRRFHDAHRDRYGYSVDHAPVEVVNVRVRAEGPQPPLPSPSIPDNASDSARGSRRILLGNAERDVAIHDRDPLRPDDTVDGPAIVHGIDSTCLLLDGQRATVDGQLNLIVRER